MQNEIASTQKLSLARRWFLRECGVGLAGIAASTLLAQERPAATVRQPHFAPKAKSVIYLFHAGAPSHLELFDPKPELQKNHGQPASDAIVQAVSGPRNTGSLMNSPFAFT